MEEKNTQAELLFLFDFAALSPVRPLDKGLLLSPIGLQI